METEQTGSRSRVDSYSTVHEGWVEEAQCELAVGRMQAGKGRRQGASEGKLQVRERFTQVIKGGRLPQVVSLELGKCGSSSFKCEVATELPPSTSEQNGWLHSLSGVCSN